MTPIFFLNPPHPCHGGIDRPSGILEAPIRPPKLPYIPLKATQFALSTLNVGEDPSSHLKISNDAHLFFQPTSSMPWGRRSTIWDPMGPRGPHQTLQTPIHTPKVTQFSLSTLNVGKDPSSRPKNANDTHLFSQPTSSMPWGRRSTICDPGAPIRLPKPPYIPLKRPNFPYQLKT